MDGVIGAGRLPSATRYQRVQPEYWERVFKFRLNPELEASPALTETLLHN